MKPGIWVVALFALVMVGCDDHNYHHSGQGDEFGLTGVVTDTGERSIRVDVTQIDYANDDAADWMHVGESHQIHDNCNCGDGFWDSSLTVGEAYSSTGAVIEPSEVPIGSCVLFIGAIRQSGSGKYVSYRPVYTSATVVPCG